MFCSSQYKLEKEEIAANEIRALENINSVNRTMGAYDMIDTIMPCYTLKTWQVSI